MSFFKGKGSPSFFLFLTPTLVLSASIFHTVPPQPSSSCHPDLINFTQVRVGGCGFPCSFPKGEGVTGLPCPGLPIMTGVSRKRLGHFAGNKSWLSHSPAVPTCVCACTRARASRPSDNRSAKQNRTKSMHTPVHLRRVLQPQRSECALCS